MSHIVTQWQTASLTLGSAQDFTQFLDRYSGMGFEVKALSTFGHVERNGNVVQYYTLLMQRPVKWESANGSVTYPD